MTKNHVKPMVEGGVLSAISILFALIGTYFPVLGQFVYLLLPVPMILLGVRHGRRWSILALVVTALLVALLANPLQGLTILVGMGLLGVVMGHALRMSFSPGRLMLWGTAASFLSKLAALGLSALIIGVNPIDMQLTAMDQAVGPTMDLYRTMGVSEEMLSEMQIMMGKAVEMIKAAFWVLLALGSAFETYINILVAKVILKRMGTPVVSFPPFKRWQFPNYLLYLFLLSLGMMYLGDYQGILLLKNLGINMAFATGSFLGVQGVAVFAYLADKYALSKAARWAIFLLIVLYGLHFFLFVGAFDMALDYRRLKEQGSV